MNPFMRKVALALLAWLVSFALLYLNDWVLPFGRHGLIVQFGIPAYITYRLFFKSKNRQLNV